MMLQCYLFASLFASAEIIIIPFLSNIARRIIYTAREMENVFSNSTTLAFLLIQTKKKYTEKKLLIYSNHLNFIRISIK